MRRDYSGEQNDDASFGLIEIGVQILALSFTGMGPWTSHLVHWVSVFSSVTEEE